MEGYHALARPGVSRCIFGLSIFFPFSASALITVGVTDNPVGGHCVAVAGGLAYVAEDRGFRSLGRLLVIDVSNPGAPIELSAIETPGEANDVAVVSGLAYVSDGSLRIIDVSNPAAPVEVGALSTPGFAVSVVHRKKKLRFWQRPIIQIRLTSAEEWGMTPRIGARAQVLRLRAVYGSAARRSVETGLQRGSRPPRPRQ